eukprot:7766101-Alexandrium_andersonii.AAC.1
MASPPQDAARIGEGPCRSCVDRCAMGAGRCTKFAGPRHCAARCARARCARGECYLGRPGS